MTCYKINRFTGYIITPSRQKNVDINMDIFFFFLSLLLLLILSLYICVASQQSEIFGNSKIQSTVLLCFISSLSNFDQIYSRKMSNMLSENDCSTILITKLRLSRRQYYSSMEKLMNAALVGRISGKYSLTSVGKVIFYSYEKIETAIKYHWKLKAVDSILMSANVELPVEECQRIIDNLIDNNEIKAVLISNNICESQCYASSGQKQQEQQYQQRRGTRQLKELLTH
jgi:hypothetical protein